MSRYKSTEVPLDFFRRLLPTGCWEWGGARDQDGYGQTRTGMDRVKAHRKVWELLHGPIPDGLYALHRCNNPPCCRPDHLYLGTALDNGIDRRSLKRGRRRLALSPAEVEDIRRRFASGTIRQRDLAEEYGIHQATVSKIVLGKSYRFDIAERSNIKR